MRGKSGRGKPREFGAKHLRGKGKREMNGLHIPGTPLVVDYWKQKHVQPRALFFLSHLHADHTCGLSSRWPYRIHCTPLTARLLLNKFKIRRSLIVELEVGESRILHVDGLSERVSVTVTVMDANHCPGSAMFLFEGYFGRILYTGDFRYSPTMASLPQIIQSQPIDLLFLDNTYCHSSCVFPSREVATEEVISYIRGNQNGVTLLGLHTLGKEDLLVAIAKRLGLWIGVPPEHYDKLHLIEADNVFTTDVDSCLVRVLPFHIALRAGLRITIDEDASTLVILPTCVYIGDNAPLAPSHPSIKVVPYSDHSSFNELVEFVGVVKPRSVRPIVKNFSGRDSTVVTMRLDMSVFSHLLDPTPMTGFEVPRLIYQFFVNEDCRDNKPHPSPVKSPPVLSSSRKPLEGGSGGRGGNGGQPRRRKRAGGGVSYLSPSKERSHDSHVTVVETRRTDDSKSHDGQVIREAKQKETVLEMMEDQEIVVVQEIEGEEEEEEKKKEGKKEKKEEEEEKKEEEEEEGKKEKITKQCEEEDNMNLTNQSPFVSPNKINSSVKPHPPPPPPPMLHSPPSILEPHLKKPMSKSVLSPEIRALFNAHHSTSVRSSVFYGSHFMRSRKRSSSSSSSMASPDVLLEEEERGGGKARALPTTLTQPVWMTKISKEWGSVLDGLIIQGPGGGGGGGGEKGGKVGGGGGGGEKGGKVGGRGGGEGKVERGRGETDKVRILAVKQDTVRAKGEKLVQGKTKGKGKERIHSETPPLDTVFKKPLHRPPMATVGKKRSGSHDDKPTKTIKNSRSVNSPCPSSSMPPPLPLPSSPSLPMNFLSLNEFLSQSTKSCDSHVIPTFSQTAEIDIPFDFADRLLGIA